MGEWRQMSRIPIASYLCGFQIIQIGCILNSSLRSFGPTEIRFSFSFQLLVKLLGFSSKHRYIEPLQIFSVWTTWLYIHTSSLKSRPFEKIPVRNSFCTVNFFLLNVMNLLFSIVICFSQRGKTNVTSKLLLKLKHWVYAFH